MIFTIKSIILWPKDTSKSMRIISFDSGNVNIITGGSSRGKSAIISIIDYCLGSEACKIPINTIRKNTAWFGVVIKLENSELLLARKEPGLNKSSGEMYMREGDNLTIPEAVTENCNFADVKIRLDAIANLPKLDFKDDDNNSGFLSRPSFRDMVSFNFQPQYIIANQSSLFYKSDSSKHREKLKSIFRYVLKAVDNKYLEHKEELRENERELQILNRELEKSKRISQRWIGEIRANYIKALEFGLLENAPYPNDDWGFETYIYHLRRFYEKVENEDYIPDIPVGLSYEINDRVSKLQSEEIDVAHVIQDLKTRLELVKKVESSNSALHDSLLSQYQRLNSISWFNKSIEESTTCPFCDAVNTTADKYIKQLSQVNSQIIEKGVKTNNLYKVLNDEIDRIKKELFAKENRVNEIRSELRIIQRSNENYNKQLQTINTIYKFSGSLGADLKNYDLQQHDSELQIKIKERERRISEIEALIDQAVVDRKTKNALDKINAAIKYYAQIFNAENSSETIRLNITDLTIDFVTSEGYNNSLYEIGSGSNYMAYHLSVMLALHEFFLKFKNHPVPNFIVFDQPSQAYFPDVDAEEAGKDEDIDRVKKIFEVLENAIKRTEGKLQIIILEHVGQYAWENYKFMKKVKRWRDGEDDHALIPHDWL